MADPGRPGALRDVRSGARDLRRWVDALVRQLAGEPDDDEDGAGGVPGARVLVYDDSTATIRYSLVKRIKSTTVTPAPPVWLLPVLQELLVTSRFRLRCMTFDAARVGDAAIGAAAEAVYAATRSRLEREYYGRRRDQTDAQLVAAGLLAKDAFARREVARAERELRHLNAVQGAAAAMEQARLRQLLLALPLVRQGVARRERDPDADLGDLVGSLDEGLARDVVRSLASGSGAWHL